jgi:hypothetical protein
VSNVTEPDRPPTRNRKKDFWTLDVPLVVVLAICISATVIEVGRAGAGNWRAAVYSIEWPIIGAFAIWMWVRFKREGGSFRGITRRWQERVAKFEAEADAAEQVVPREPAKPDPELDAWNTYRDGVHKRDQERS